MQVSTNRETRCEILGRQHFACIVIRHHYVLATKSLLKYSINGSSTYSQVTDDIAMDSKILPPVKS